MIVVDLRHTESLRIGDEATIDTIYIDRIQDMAVDAQGRMRSSGRGVLIYRVRVPPGRLMFGWPNTFHIVAFMWTRFLEIYSLP